MTVESTKGGRRSETGNAKPIRNRLLTGIIPPLYWIGVVVSVFYLAYGFYWA